MIKHSACILSHLKNGANVFEASFYFQRSIDPGIYYSKLCTEFPASSRPYNPWATPRELPLCVTSSLMAPLHMQTTKKKGFPGSSAVKNLPTTQEMPV